MKKIKKIIYFIPLILIFQLLSDEPIIFNTLPKSGSVYIGQTLSKGLNKPFQRISHNTFPQDPIIVDKLLSLINTNGCTQEHLDASPHNVSLLKKFNLKIIVHIRDPRQAIISWTHHLNRIKNDPSTLALSTPIPTKGYFDKSLSEQFDWQINTYLPLFIEWINGWIKVKKQNELSIKFTTYENFNKNTSDFFEGIFKFYQISRSSFINPYLEKTMAYHYRQGLTDEWKYVLTSEQKEKVNAMIPEEFFTIFNWEK